jgi:hypothetical protein
VGQGTKAYKEKKQADAETRKRRRQSDDRARRIADLESRIADHERAIRELETQMAAPGFFEAREIAQQVASRHQNLMWEVGNLMNQWEALQTLEGNDREQPS